MKSLFAPPTGAAAKPVGTLAVYTACGKAAKRRGYLGSKPSGPRSNLETGLLRALTLECDSGYTSSTFDRCQIILTPHSKCGMGGREHKMNDLVVVLGFSAQTLYRGMRPSRRFPKFFYSIQFLGVTDVTPRLVLSQFQQIVWRGGS